MNYLPVIILGVLSVLIIIGVIFMYNKLVNYKSCMQEAWSSIEVCLKKRHDLIFDLIETEEITRYRTDAMQAPDRRSRLQAENKLEKALRQLFVAVENDSELKANTNFLELQRQLVDIESELATLRRSYNGTVRRNNIFVESFPSNIIARLFQFSKGEFFIIETAELILHT
jgi:LemA protein